MKSIFYIPRERRYAQYPRRYLNEYHIYTDVPIPDAKGACATLASARKHAGAAIELGQCHVVRIFDRKTGQYVFTYKGNKSGYQRFEGHVR